MGKIYIQSSVAIKSKIGLLTRYSHESRWGDGDFCKACRFFLHRATIIQRILNSGYKADMHRRAERQLRRRRNSFDWRNLRMARAHAASRMRRVHATFATDDPRVSCERVHAAKDNTLPRTPNLSESRFAPCKGIKNPHVANIASPTQSVRGEKK